MNSTEADIRIIEDTVSIYPESGIISNLESHATGLAHHYMSSFWVELTVYLVQLLRLGPYLLLRLLPTVSYGRSLHIIVTLLFGLLINGKHAREYRLLIEVEHIVCISPYLIESAGILNHAHLLT